jgi:signal transduction histidine kinase
VKLFPASLAARASLVLIAGFAVIEVAGLTIEAMDRMDFDRRMARHQVMSHVAMIYRTVEDAKPADRAAVVEDLNKSGDFSASLSAVPPKDLTYEIPERDLPLLLSWAEMRPRENDGPPPMRGFEGPWERPESPPLFFLPKMGRMLPPPDGFRGGFGDPPPLRFFRGGGRPLHILSFPQRHGRHLAVAMQLPDDSQWLEIRTVLPRATPFSSPLFPLAFALMTAVGGTLIVIAVRRLLAPVGTLVVAAENLVPDDNAAPLPEKGPLELVRAAVAFNAMAARIRRFVSDRTLVLTAIGHDLRTPITRMKLRAEFIDDEELREKFLSDLNELTSMVDATLAYGRESSGREPLVDMDLRALLHTVVDDLVESRPGSEERLVFDEGNIVGRAPVIIRGRPVALKRAFTNLAGNALNYAGGAIVRLTGGGDHPVVVTIDDEGPGLPEEDLTRMFEPFVRMEESRNRETGGAGLGLAIVRTIIRGHGGDVILKNRHPHGLSAIVTLS